MLITWTNRIVSLSRRITTSIAFWPTVLAVGFGVLAMGLLAIDTAAITTWLLEKTPTLVIKDDDTARIILSTIAAGLVSLTVFSFTMVMSQLSRAATNYSPRLLPGLVSEKRHQIVLGILLGTITYCLIVLISIEPDEDSYQLPGLAILIGCALGLGCLGLFVYFIHAISRDIQIQHILRRVATQTALRLESLADSKLRNPDSQDPELFDDTDSVTMPAEHSGYFGGCNPQLLASIAAEHDFLIEVSHFRGDFVLADTPLVRVSREVDDDIREKIYSCLRFDTNELVGDNYILGFKQVTEIAVRAMSPGTNDPGTALNAIDYLTQLLATRMRIDDREVHSDDGGSARLFVKVVSFSDLLFLIHASLRQYCKHDVTIVMKLLQMFSYLSKVPNSSEQHRETVCKEARVLLVDATANIENAADRQAVKNLADGNFADRMTASTDQIVDDQTEDGLGGQ